MHKICVIPGDGVGPEIMDSTLAILECLDVPVTIEKTQVGVDSFDKHGSYLTDDALDMASEADAILFGALTTPKDKNYVSPLLLMRWNLELYANVRPTKCLNPEFCLTNLDTTIIRENTEGLYGAVEREVDDGKIVTERVISETGCKRIIEFAFQHAISRGHKKVSCVHKANVLRSSDAMFKQLFYGSAVNYAFYNKIKSDDYYVDAAAMFLAKEPERFDLIVTLNLYGDILSDEAAGLTGGLGFAPSANIGEKHALFEPVHGSATEIANKDIANPTGSILSAAMMLEYLKMKEKAELIRDALYSVYADLNKWTKDVGGSCGTEEFTWHLRNEIENLAAAR
jgi:methanogen homoisocitrate dehydrogenase